MNNKLEYQLKRLYEMAKWYEDFKPDTKTITITDELMKAISKRDVPGIAHTESGVWYNGFRLVTHEPS